jgi:hypothetical protein
MRSFVPIVTVALALMLPASAALARPVDDPKGFAGAGHVIQPAPAPVPSGDGGAEALGYLVVGLGGFALGAVGYARASTVRRSRRAVAA